MTVAILFVLYNNKDVKQNFISTHNQSFMKKKKKKNSSWKWETGFPVCGNN